MPSADDLRKPMRFIVHPAHESGCFGNAVNWPFLAVGVITDETPLLFEKFAADHQGDSIIEFNSPGGNLVAAMKLGDLIRKHRFDTSLGELCASACVYALIGGVKRYVHLKNETDRDNADHDGRRIGATGTNLGIHQFYHPDAISEPDKKAFSAIDRSSDQIITGLLLEYTIRMGVDPQLIAAASSVEPKILRYITTDEMISWNIDNTTRWSAPIECSTLNVS
jgi:hypothetical protein